MGDWLPIAAAAILGLLCGSFTNVLIARVPSGEDWVREPSRCPRCRTPIAWYDNVPVLAWLWLRRRCRSCGAPISARYPVVELTVAVLFALSTWVYGVSVLTALLCLLAITTVALAAIDFEHMRLPDALVFPSAAAALVLLVVAAAVSGDWAALGRGALGALILGGLYFVLWFAYPRGMGFGDVKLAVPLGLVLGFMGWGVLAVGAILGPVLGTAAGVVAMLRARAWRGVRMPYGPWMIAGFWVAVLWGAQLYDDYLAWASGWS